MRSVRTNHRRWPVLNRSRNRVAPWSSRRPSALEVAGDCSGEAISVPTSTGALAQWYAVRALAPRRRARPAPRRCAADRTVPRPSPGPPHPVSGARRGRPGGRRDAWQSPLRCGAGPPARRLRGSRAPESRRPPSLPPEDVRNAVPVAVFGDERCQDEHVGPPVGPH